MVLVYGVADSCLHNKQNNTWTLGDMELFYLLMFTFDISLLCCAHLFDVDVNTQRFICGT